MKNTLLSILVVVALYGVASAGSSLRVSNSHYDFGWMPYNSTVVHYFWFKSVGNDTLHIDPVNTRSDVARMPLEQTWLAPGDSMKVAAYWDTGSKGQAVERRMIVVTDSYVDDPQELLLKGIAVVKPDSLRPVLILPYKLEFSRLGAMSIDSISFVMTNYSDRDFELELVSVLPDEVEIFIPDSLGAREEKTGYVKVIPSFQNSEFLTSITIQLTNATNYQKRITIPIRRKIYSE